jgi:Holliday junction resolvase RusA-like endonuclease
MPMVRVWRGGFKKWTTKPERGDELVFGEKLRAMANTYNPDTADEWRAAIAKKVEQAWSIYTPDPKSGHRGVGKLREPLTGPVICDLAFYFPRTKEMLDNPFKYGRQEFPCIAHNKGDIDNLQKAVFDVMTEVGVWKDDCQVYGGLVEKWYTPIGHPCGVKIIVTTEAELVESTLFETAVKA